MHNILLVRYVVGITVRSPWFAHESCLTIIAKVHASLKRLEANHLSRSRHRKFVREPGGLRKIAKNRSVATATGLRVFVDVWC